MTTWQAYQISAFIFRIATTILRLSWILAGRTAQHSPPKDVFATQHTSQNPRLAMTQNSLNTRQYRHCERLAKQSGVIFQHKTPLTKPNVVGTAIPTFKITLFA